MKKSTKYLLTIIHVYCIGILNIEAQSYDNSLIDIDNIRSNLEILASDQMEGREATTAGAIKASDFIASELKKYGVQPFGDNDSYFQNFDLRFVQYEEESQLILKNNINEQYFKYAVDFGKGARGFSSLKYTDQTTDLVFVSYGITADEYDYDDYEDIDAKGKTVIMISGEPYSENENFFKGDADTKYANGSEKIKNAKDRGAVGVIYVPSKRALSFWNGYMRWAKSASYQLPEQNEEQKDEDKLPVFLMSVNMASKVLDDEEISYEELKNILEENDYPYSFELSKTLEFDIQIEDEFRVARNVIGIIEGNNPVLRDEYVTIGAHYDHEGIKNGEVYNGADDNASGTTTVLEIARSLSMVKENNRSIILIFHTAEEKGLLGAKYLTNNKDFIENTVVNINMDMVGGGSIDSIHNIGSNKLSSELYNVIEKVNKETVNFTFDYRFNAPDDPQRLYYRSDHIHYARKGIPIVFFFDYYMEHYHQASDDVETINFEKIAKVSNLIHNLAIEIANLDHQLIVDEEKLEESSNN